MRSWGCSRPAQTLCARSRSSLAAWRSASRSQRPTPIASPIRARSFEAKIRVALGGRVAEEIVYGTITTGAESDIQQLTLIARQMVGRWGMSEAVGPIAVLPADGDGMFLPGVSATSESTQRLLDEEVHKLVESAHEEVTRLLLAHREQLDSLAQALLKTETLDAQEAYEAAGVPAHEPEPSAVS